MLAPYGLHKNKTTLLGHFKATQTMLGIPQTNEVYHIFILTFIGYFNHISIFLFDKEHHKGIIT